MDGESSQVSQISRPVPKFASFGSGVSSSPAIKVAETLEKNTVLEGLDAKTASSQNRNVKHHRRSKDARKSHHLDRPSSLVKLQHTQALLQPLAAEKKHERDSSNSFIVDRIGDPKNLTYGSLPSLVIPSYFRFGGGKVLGFSKQNTIDRANSTDRVIVIQRGHHDLLGKRNKAISLKINRHGLKTVPVRSDRDSSQDIDLAADFVSLQGSKEKKGHDSNESLSADDRSTYCSVTGISKPLGQLVDQDLAYNSDTSTSENERGRSYTINNDVLQQRMALSAKVEEDPGNCDAWLDLIDYQDKILGLDIVSVKPRLTAAERQSTADVKISLYEKAIRAAESLKDKERLLLGMMQEGSKIWDDAKISSKWRSLLKEYPTSMNLWTKYLDFRQSEFLSFRYEEVCTTYLDCLRLLRQTRLDTEVSTERTSIYIIQVYVTLRMTVFMREAGFAEHATACWQAITEYNFCKPIQYQSLEYHIGGRSESTALSAFESFWESEVPRFGEDHAEGWANFVSQSGKPAPSKRDAEKGSTDCDLNFDSWIRLEREISLQSRISARTGDDTDENDPYRVTLFSDVQPVLIDSPDIPGRLMLVEALFIFCHLPSFSRDTSDHTKTWWRDSFLRNEILHQSHDPFDLLTSNSDSAGSEFVEVGRNHTISSIHAHHKNRFLLFPMPCHRLSASSLFAAKGSWFSAFESWENEFNENQGPVELGFVRCFIRAFVHLGIGGDDLAEYYIAFESRLSHITAKKLAKTLIKHRPSSLRLYRSYAVVEYRLGNAKIADHVMATTLNMSKSLSEEAQRDFILLWCTWIWELVELGELALALERILMLSDQTIAISQDKPSSSLNSSIEPALSLRTQNALTAARDHFTSLALLDHAVNAIECLLLYAYLSSELSLEAAHAAFMSNLDFLSSHFPPSSSSHEHVHQGFARLLHYHVTHIGRFKPIMVRSSLTESITQFPQNTIFLALYAWIESRSRIDDRVRSIMRDVVLTKNRRTGDYIDETVISHFFAIYSELSRGVTLGSNSSAIRSAFERAVNSTCGAHCAGLWKLYFRFELSRGDFQLAKNIFYRAVRACPWAKELYMLAFRDLGSVMDEREAGGVYKLLEEKGIRIHCRRG